MAHTREADLKQDGIEINWRHCASYDGVRDFSRVIYLHEWDGKAFYWLT
jgi:hypothetical protein